MQFNYAEALGDDVLGKIASFLTEKKLPERSWIQYKYYHKICLEHEHDREWAEECDRKANPITLQMYDTIIQNTEKIFAFVTRPPIVFIKDDIAKELMELYGGGWISDAQYFAVKKRCGIEAERPITSWVKRKKKKRKKKKKPVDEDNKFEEEQSVMEECREGSSSDSSPPSLGQKLETGCIWSHRLSKHSGKPVYVWGHRLGKRNGKRNKNYVLVYKPLKGTPRTHNYRRKDRISKQKRSNYYKNKASSRGQKTPFYRLSTSETRRSLNFKRRTYRKVCNVLAALGLWNRGGKASSRKKSKRTVRQAPVEHEAVDTSHKIDTPEVDTLSSSKEEEVSDGIPYGPFPSLLYYEEENTNLNPRRYGLDRVDSSGANETSTSALDVDTLSCFGSSSSEEEEVSDTSSTSSSSVEEYPKVSFMIRLFSVKIINVTFSLYRTIDDVRTEIQSQFGLVPSQYILKAGCKTLADDNCSLLEYNIQSNQTLDIVLRANQCLRGGVGGADDNNSHNDIDERLKKLVSQLDIKHKLQLHERSDGELTLLLRDKSEADRLLVIQAFKVKQSQGRKKFTRDELINSFLLQRDAGFPLLRRSLMTRAEKEADRRANATEEETQARREKDAQQHAQIRANETEEETRARQEDDAQRHAQVRTNTRTAIEESWPTLNTFVGDTPGKDFKMDSHTESVEAAECLLELNSGDWLSWESEYFIAYIHVMSRLEEACKCKLNSLLELSIRRHSTLLKTVYQDVFDEDDMSEVYKWQSQTEERQLRKDEEAVLEWFATNDAISLEDRKAKLPKPWLESLVGLELEVPSNPGKIDRIDYTSKDGQLYIYKSGGIDYPITYSTVKKYNSDKNLDLPEVEPYINLAFNVRCDQTIQELRKLDAQLKSSAADNAKRSEILYKYAVDEVRVDIRSQKLTPDREKMLISKFLQAQGRGWSCGEKKCFTSDDDNAQETVDAPLMTCACCGHRNMDTSEFKRTYEEVDVSEINELRLREGDNDEDIEDAEDSDDTDANGCLEGPRSKRTQGYHRQLMEREPLSIPYNDNGDTKKVELWRLRSVWPAKKPEELNEEKDKLPDYMFDNEGNPVYYNLHPEFVQEKVSAESVKSYSATICSNCKSSLNNKRTPWRSIVSGVDFGDARRLGLEPLTERERQIISKVRHYLYVIKIESNTADGRLIERGQSKLKGHGIFFADDSTRLVSDLLSLESINGDVSLQLVGPDGEYDSLAKKVLGSANVEGRAWVIYQWLKVLQEVNDHYKYDDKLPEYDEVKATLKTANEALIKDAECVNDESVAREIQIRKDDARHIRTTGVGDVEVDVGSNSDDFPLKCSLIMSNAKNERGSDADREYLVNAAEALGNPDMKSHMTRREKYPRNDYEHGEENLVMIAPDTFIFGKAYGNKGPTLSKYEIEHLLMQYTTNAGSNRFLLCQLFESNWRHGVIGNMHAKVSSDPIEFEKVAKEFASEKFQARLRAAVKDPDGPDAKYVLNRLVPYMTFGGRKSVFGALERNQTAGEILAMIRHQGCGHSFLTFGIDDINHPNSIRFALPSSNNSTFPAVVSSASQVEMERGIKLMEGEGSIPIPQSYKERTKLMNNNPVGAAMSFKNMVHDIMSILVGIKPSNHSGDNNRTTKTVFISPDTFIGMIGTSRAFFGKTETTGSGSLHFHVIIWGGLSAELLESVADIPELCKEVASVLDSQFSAKLDRPDHIKDLVHKTIPTVKGLMKTRAAAITKSVALDTSAQDTSDKDTSGVRDDTSDINGSNGSDNDSDVQMEDVSQPASEPQTQDTPSLANSVQDTSNASRDTSNEMESDDKRSDMASLHTSPTKVSELELETPSAATLPTFEDDDIGPPRIKRRLKASTSIDTSKPGAFAALGKTLNCQDESCQHGECNQDVQDTVVMSQQYPGINVVTPTKPIISSRDALRRKGGDSIGGTNETVYSSRPSAQAMRLPPDPTKDRKLFNTHVVITICQCGIHNHTFTCHKPPNGWEGCRLCLPRAPSDGTRPIEIRLAIKPDGSEQWDQIMNEDEIQADGSTSTVERKCVDPYDSEVHITKENLSPLPSGSSRTIVWELNRPMLEPLPELNDDMTKDQIISILLNEMIGKSIDNETHFKEGGERISLDQVDIHQFHDKDKNNLFYALLLGLIVSSQLKPGKKSVQELRRELMHHLRESIRDDKTLEEHISRVAIEESDQSIEDKLELYSQLMMNVKGDDCYEGGALEVKLFAQLMNVNVAVYDEEDDNLTRVEYFASKEDDRPTIHLLRTPTKVQHRSRPRLLNPPEYNYKLFTSKLKGNTDKLRMLDLKHLKVLYGMISKALPERNGLVVDFNPMLTSLIGSNSNFLHLGSTESSKAALWYIGPYINKDGVKITDVLPILMKAQEDAMNFPSLADDSGTTKRHAQHVFTRAINKMNSLMEVSDTQIAVGLLGMGASLSSDSFVACDTIAYQKHVNAELDQTRGYSLHKALDDEGSNEENEYYDETDIIFGNEEEEEVEERGTEDNSDEEDASRADGNSLDLMECDDTNQGGNLEEEENDEDDEDFRHFNASFGAARYYKMNDGTKQPVSYAVLYRYRGKELKHLSRYAYNAIVSVVESSSAGDNDASCGRKKSRVFPFGEGLGMENNYHQVLRLKQRIPKFTKSPPAPPSLGPLSPELDDSDEGCEDQRKVYEGDLVDWTKKANKFAHFYLTMFRPETELYEKGQINTYKYDYEAFVKFYNELRCSRTVIDRLRLRRINRVVHSLRVDRDRREMLVRFRGRNRTIWSAAEKQANKEYYGNLKALKNDNDGMDYVSDAAQNFLNSQQITDAGKHLGHSSAIMSTLKDLAKTTNSSNRSGSSKSRLANVTTLPFDSALDESKRRPRVTCDEDYDANRVQRPSKYRTIPNMKKKVREYLKSQDLSSDKNVVVDLACDHFEAIRSGDAESPDYIAPLLFVSGKPGNGKSKIIQALDGVVDIMKVGSQMKCAYMGSAAVNIGGSTFIKSWSVPIFKKGDKLKIGTWNPNKLQALKRILGHDIYSMCDIVIDEVSTLQPYMLATLNARLQEMYGNSKLFGGRMVIIVGDFDQKPPTAGGKGGTLPGVVMQYIEQEGKPMTWKTSEKLSPTQMGGFLFSKFRYIKLTSQHRSGDPEHMEVLNKMSQTGVGPTVQDLKSTYKKLSAEDLANDDFRFATTIVTGNAERREINAWQSKRWAEYHGINTVRWSRAREDGKWIGRPTNQESIAHAMQNACFWEYFPPNAMGYLTKYGINAAEGLANGTEIKYHSISFEDSDQKRQFRLKSAQAKPGDIIDLDFPPTAINVELFADFDGDSTSEAAKKKRERKEWLDGGKGSITKDGRVVIPISLKDGKKGIQFDTNYIPGCTDLDSNHYYHDSMVSIKDHFPIEPAFSITVDKAQGKTIHRIILSISEHKYHLNKIKWEDLYVALSRVRMGDHMRLMINGGDWNTVAYISKLLRNEYTDWFFRGYEDHPTKDGSKVWNYNLARKNAGLDGKRKITSSKKKKSTPRKKARKKR